MTTPSWSWAVPRIVRRLARSGPGSAIVVAIGVLTTPITVSAGDAVSAPMSVTAGDLAPPTAGFAEALDLPVHYVAVHRPDDADRVTVTFKPTRGPFVLVLADTHGRGLHWDLQGAPHQDLRAVLVTFVKPTTRVDGIPPGTPVFGVHGRQFFTTELLPDVRWVREACDGSTGRRDFPFGRVERSLQTVTGQPFTSFAGTARTDAIQVPGIAVTTDLRAAIDRKAARACDAQQRKRALGKITGGHYVRFSESRKQETADLLARHPRPDYGALNDVTEVVKIIAVHGGRAKGYRAFAKLLSYDAYLENANKRRAPIDVKLQSDRPTFLVLISHEPVAWRIHPEGRSSVTGVFATSADTPKVVDLPETVPLDIRAHQLGHKDYATTVLPDRPDHRASKAIMETWAARFPSKTIDVISARHVASVTVSSHKER